MKFVGPLTSGIAGRNCMIDNVYKYKREHTYYPNSVRLIFPAVILPTFSRALFVMFIVASDEVLLARKAYDRRRMSRGLTKR